MIFARFDISFFDTSFFDTSIFFFGSLILTFLSVTVVSVSSGLSIGAREKPLKLPKKLTDGLIAPVGLLSESLRRRLELMSSGFDTV